jgi:hypothetical protein
MKRLLHAVLVILAFTGLAVGATSGPASASVPYTAYCGIGHGGGIPYLSSVHGVQAWIVYGGSAFYQDQYCQVGKTKLIQQTDGNFVLYDENHYARWATGTMNPTAFTDFQDDGNLVTYGCCYHPLWASNTCCHDFWYLAVQADGNVVIYDGNWVARWATNTNH